MEENEKDTELLEELEEDMAEEAEENSDELDEADAASEYNDSAAQFADMEEALAEANDKYLRLFAEYDNYRKRTAKEKENLYSDAVAKVTGEFLGVLDNIDRAIDSSKNADEGSIEAVIQGIEMVGKQAGEILAKIGVEEIPCERGTKFDPNLHEAVMHIEDEELGEQEVAQVFQKGYMYKERVIRHAVVQVAN